VDLQELAKTTTSTNAAITIKIFFIILPYCFQGDNKESQILTK